MRKPSIPPDISPLWAGLPGLEDAVLREILGVGATDEKGRYFHWDDLRYREPPEGLTIEQWWLGTVLARGQLRRSLPLTDNGSQPFTVCMVDPVWESLHRIDKAAAGQILADDPLASQSSGDRYIVSSLIEEAVASSQLEGASTTRAVAKEMLLTGRRPTDHSERMIVNNYAAINAVRALVAAGTPFSLAEIQELHRVITRDTLTDPRDAGRLQQPGEKRVAVYAVMARPGEELLHRPPPADQLPSRLEALCAFANGEADAGFVHPVVRAVITHFWLAYDHPFVDGNGRLARSLFYWSMLRSGYWLTEYLSVSAILRDAPAQYNRAFLLTETDSNDLTYFVAYQLEVIERAVRSLREYLERKRAEVRELESYVRGDLTLNHRQRDVLSRALRDPFSSFYISGHQRRHGVTYASARSDLLALEKLGLLYRTRDGRVLRFVPVSNLVDQLRTPSRRSHDGVRSGA